jgi:hypothetical protein
VISSAHNSKNKLSPLRDGENVNSTIQLAILLATSRLFVLFAFGFVMQNSSTNSAKEATMTAHAKGTFEVKLLPLPTSDSSEGSPLGRMSIDKQIHGDLEAVSKGEMLTAATGVKGSAGYVAIERVSGSLNGRSGSFVLQHSSTLTRGTPQQSITVVPDSATGQLVGLTGKFLVIITEGKHSYEFDYSLPENNN